MIELTINGKVIPFTESIFSGGEVHVKIDRQIVDNNPKDIYVTALLRSSDDVMKLLLLNNAINHIVIKSLTCKRLVLYYTPYSRQDRVCNEGEAFSLKVFTDLVNSMGFDQVFVFDPHSDVTPALIENSVVCTQAECIRAMIESSAKFAEFCENATLVSPDAGSNKKMLSVCKVMNKDSFVRADKIRDTMTGGIQETIVYADKLSGDYLIVDDICDGGRTFIELAKKLKELGADRVGLYTTVGIFSRGRDNLSPHVDFIFVPKSSDWELGNNV